VFSIPSPRLGDRKHTTRWIKIVSHQKPWEILYFLEACFDVYVLFFSIKLAIGMFLDVKNKVVETLSFLKGKIDYPTKTTTVMKLY
jgi:hypothetical protein